MIQLIGFMIGAYIITRMAEILNQKETANFVALLSIVTIVVVLACLFGLFTTGGQISSLANEIPRNN